MGYRTISAFIISGMIACCSTSPSWIPQASMPTSRSDLSAATVNDRIIVAGGCLEQICPVDLSSCVCVNVTNVVEAYLPLQNKWITLPPMPIPRFRHGVVALNSIMIVMGGRDVNDTILQTVDAYNADTNTWSTLPSLWTQATSDLVAVMVGTVIYAIGGYDAFYDSLNQTCTFEAFLNDNATWVCDQVPGLNQGRGDACGVSVRNSQIFVFGGFSDINFCAPLDTLEVYYVANKTWVTESRLHKPRADSACAFLHGEFHAVGGEQKSNVTNCLKYDIPINDVEYWNVADDTWIEEAPLSDARFRFSGAVYTDTIYLFGGQGLEDPITGIQPVLNEVSSLSDPVTSTTSSATSFFHLLENRRIIIAILLMFAPIFF